MQPSEPSTSVDRVAATLVERAAVFRSFVAARVPASEVDDVLQRAALRALERASSVRDPDKALPWLYRLHRNAIVDAARTRGADRRLREHVANVGAPAPDGSPQLEGRCGCSVVQAQRLRATLANVLLLVDVEGLTPAEAAEALGITVNNVNVRLHRARRELKRRMKDHCGVTAARECLDCRCVDDGCCAA